MRNITNKELQRMKDLMGIRKPINESNVLSSTELIKEAPNGKFYGIVRENKKYFIKESNDGVNFDFIGGLVNKTKNQFESYEQAVRRLNLMLEDTNVLTPDIISEKKFVIKTKKKKKKAETEDEGGFGNDETASTDEGDDFDFGDDEETTSTEEGDDFGDEEGNEDEDASTDEEDNQGDDFDFGDEEEDASTEEGDEEDLDFGDEETDEDVSAEEGDEDDLDLEDDPIKSIQKMTGKLGQKIRDTEDLSSDTMKWVAKSVISALDLDQMDAEDKKDIIRAIKKKESEGSDEEFDFMADWSSMSADEKNKLVNGDSMYGPPTNVERGEKIIIDDDNESHCSYCSDNRSMPYDEEDDEYPGMGSDWRRPMSYMDDPYMMPQPERETTPTREKEEEEKKERKTPPSRKPFEAPPFIDPNDPDANPNPKAEYECTQCNGHGYDDMTGEECEWCMGTGYDYQYNQPTDRYYDNVQDYGTSQVIDYMEDIDLGPKIHGRPSNDRVTHRGTKSKTYLSNNQKSNRAAKEQARLDMGNYFGGINKDKSPTDEWRKHQLPYDTKFDFMEDDDMEMCNACEGKGREMHRIGFSRRESDCPICDGAGYVPRAEVGGEVDEPYIDDSNPMGYKSSSTLPSKVGYNVQYREKFNSPFNMGENSKRNKRSIEEGGGNDHYQAINPYDPSGTRDEHKPTNTKVTLKSTPTADYDEEDYWRSMGMLSPSYSESSSEEKKSKEEPKTKEKPKTMGSKLKSFGKKMLGLKEDHINDKMATYDQELAYEDVEDMARQNGMEVEFCHKDRSKDVEEQTVYLDLMKNGKAVAKIRINSVGQIEMGHMTGKVFKGEPVDSYPDFDEVLREKRIRMNPAPAPSRPQTRPETPVKPAKPGTDRPSPSKRPFTPPPHITPGEEPNIKARYPNKVKINSALFNQTNVSRK